MKLIFIIVFVFISTSSNAVSIDDLMEMLTKSPYNNDSRKFIKFVNNRYLIGKSDSSGHTPFFVAAMNNQPEVLTYLLENGSNINHLDKRGYNILFYAHVYGLDTAIFLVNNGIQLNKISINGHTALITCIISKNTEFCSWLLKNKSLRIINHIDKKGATAAYYAAATGNLRLVKLLHQSGADFTLGRGNIKPVNGAIGGKHLAVENYIISKSTK